MSFKMLTKASIGTCIIVMLTICSGTLLAQSGSFDWMPIPKQWEHLPENFRLTSEFRVKLDDYSSDRLEAYATRFLRRLDKKTGLFFPQEDVNSSIERADFLIKVKREGELTLEENEAYQLLIKADQMELIAETDIGAMRGLETLFQILDADKTGYFFPGIKIDDEPRFPWRGLMIDVARHFQPINVIKRNIDGLAAVKMNVLHLHLVDDHGFRVESKVFPELHTRASKGEYFTQLEIREIVKYAADRGIRVVPEFDVPGHASAFLTAFPNLGSAPGPYHLQNRSGIFDPTLNPANEETYTFLNALFTEMSGLFPDEYFHVGGDENEGKHWMANDEIQAFMKENGFRDIHELQNYFIIRIQKHLTSLDKKMIGWDEILSETLPKDAVIHSWRGISSLKEASEKGYQCILSNGFYIDLMKRASDHYVTDPLPKGLDLPAQAAANILGGEATMWSELAIPETIDSRIWPRTAAIAERLWSPSHVRDIDEMYRRLPIVSLELERLGLAQIKNRHALMRNLANGYDIEPISVLASVAEPLEGYSRNPGGKFYEFHYAFNRFADITIADAEGAREFVKLVDAYELGRRSQTKDSIKSQLQVWRDNHDKILRLIERSPALKEVEGLSKKLKTVAELGLEALSIKSEGLTPSERKDWYDAAMRTLSASAEQNARTTLQIIEPLRKLVRLEMAQINARKSSGKITIDGDLGDWSTVTWDHFVPVFTRGWNDTCHYAVQWDEDRLYFAFKVENDNLLATRKSRDETGLHLDDGIEILIDTDSDASRDWRNDDLAYHVNVLNVIMDDKGTDEKGRYNNTWDGKAETMVKVLGTVNDETDEDIGYHVEFAIDWEELGKKPAANLVMRINVGVNDTDDLHREYRYYDYMGLNVFHHPASFAELVLVE